MTFTDKISKQIEGLFKIQCFDINDNLIDEYEDKNLVLNTARNAVAAVIGGTSTTIVDSFYLGTKGHRYVDDGLGGFTEDVFQPHDSVDTDPLKPIGNQTFTVDKTSMFSNSTVGGIDGAITYKFPFDPTLASNNVFGEKIVTDATVVPAVLNTTSTDTVATTISRTLTDNNLTFVINIPTGAGNDTNPIPFTEAALYSGSNIFSMKTYQTRVKTNTVKFVITWTITF